MFRFSIKLAKVSQTKKTIAVLNQLISAQSISWSELLRQFLTSAGSDYLSRLRRDSVGADFQSVRKLTNYICAKPPESRVRLFSSIYRPR